jgi:hypothetical protein
MTKLYRLPEAQRFAQAIQHRSNRVQVTTTHGKVYTGRLLAVGRALHGTSTGWLALASSPLDRFISLATVETIERIPD